MLGFPQACQGCCIASRMLQIWSHACFAVQPGDELLITTTSAAPYESERQVIAAVNGTQVGLAGPLQYTHAGPAAGSTGAEVAVLTRAVRVVGHQVACSSDAGAGSQGSGSGDPAQGEPAAPALLLVDGNQAGLQLSHVEVVGGPQVGERLCCHALPPSSSGVVVGLDEGFLQPLWNNFGEPGALGSVDGDFERTSCPPRELDARASGAFPTLMFYGMEIFISLPSSMILHEYLMARRSACMNIRAPLCQQQHALAGNAVSPNHSSSLFWPNLISSCLVSPHVMSCHLSAAAWLHSLPHLSSGLTLLMAPDVRGVQLVPSVSRSATNCALLQGCSAGAAVAVAAGASLQAGSYMTGCVVHDSPSGGLAVHGNIQVEWPV